MELKSDYKQTEVGVLPREWDSKKLGDLFTLRNGFAFSSVFFSNSGPVVLTPGNFRLDGGLYFDNGNTKRYSGPYDPSLVFDDGDLLIVMTDLTPQCNLLGKPAFVHTGEFILHNQRIGKVLLRSPLIEKRYLYYVLLSRPYLARLRELATGSTVRHTSNKSIYSVLIPLPTSKEQEAISDALEDVDALINGLEDLITKTRDLKQAVMQQLLTGKRRLPGFSEKWKAKSLGDLGVFTKGKGIKKDQVVQDGVPCIRYGEIYTVHNDVVRQFFSFIPRETTKESQLIRKGDLLFAGSGETAEEIGKCVAFLGDEEAYAGGDIVIFTPKEQNSMYLGYLMNHPSIICQKARMGQGDAVVHISASNLGQLELFLPKKEEQAAIAVVLSDMDAEIGALEQRLDKTRDLKQGMMQELLTGKTRLI